jgi:hypothetical protein
MNAFCLNNENAVDLALEEHEKAIDQIQQDFEPVNLFDENGNKLDN